MGAISDALAAAAARAAQIAASNKQTYSQPVVEAAQQGHPEATKASSQDLDEAVAAIKDKVPTFTNAAMGVANNMAGDFQASSELGDGTYVGDGGYIQDLGASTPPAPPAPKLVNYWDENAKMSDSSQQEQDNTWVNDLGQIQGTEQLNTGKIDTEAPKAQMQKEAGLRENSTFDWGSYYGESFEKPTEENWVGENGQVFGNAPEKGIGAIPDLGISGEDVIDNGTNAYANRTSAFITAEEAERQAKAQGLDELVKDLEYVPADMILSKTDLENNYGYQSYVPDAETKFQRDVIDVADKYNNWVGKIGNLRGDIAENTGKVKVGDKEYSIRDVDTELQKKANEYAKAFEDAGYDPMNMPGTLITSKATGDVFRSDDIMELMADMDNNLFYVLNDGREIYIGNDGGDTSVPLTNFVTYEPPAIDLFGEQVRIQDLNKYTTNQDILASFYDWRTNDELNQLSGMDQELRDAVVDYENGTINGKPATAEQLQAKLLADSAAKNIKYGFGGKPLYATRQMVEYNDDGSIKHINVPSLSNLADMGLQSATWFLPPTQLANMATGTVLSGAGIDPMASQSGQYSPVGELATAPAIYLASGVGESTLGGVGAGAGKGLFDFPVEKMLGKRKNAPIANHVIKPAITEAAEEVTMNPLWDYAAEGAEGWGADNTYDEYGNVTGVDPNTPLADRIWNEMQQVPEGAMGGALMGGVLGAAGGAKAKATGQWAAEKADYKSGIADIEVPKPRYLAYSPENQKIINHELERTRF